MLDQDNMLELGAVESSAPAESFPEVQLARRDGNPLHVCAISGQRITA